MGETQNLSRFLNPWVLHLQKLGLELKCPLCLNLLSRPVLLPCGHVFCNSCIPGSTHYGSECPACKQVFADQDIRPAPYMENIIGIYKTLDATLNASLFPSATSDGPVSVNTKVENELRKFSIEIPKEGNSCNGRSIISPANNCASVSLNGEKVKSMIQQTGGQLIANIGVKSISLPTDVVQHDELAREELDINEAVDLSPLCNSFSGHSKGAGGNISDPGSINNCIKECAAKKSVKESFDCAGGHDMNYQPICEVQFDPRDAKRQKKLSYEPCERSLKINTCIQKKRSQSGSTATSNGLKNSELLSSSQPSATSGLSSASGTVCAFCHSSKFTDGSGPMLYYANGKEVAGDLSTFTNVIPVHQKCIDWTPQVYYVDETIKNLESELARAAKLKCSSCGLKGAALGCYVTSCRKSYHVPCAFQIEECRWDCEDFLLMCPSHKNVKFPREKSKSRKLAFGERHHVPTQIVPKHLDFWVTSTGGMKQWVFCGSALSSEEKYHLTKFASICGAIVVKFWKPNVTHVIAATDGKGACSRTLKVLMAILNGRWIVTMDWIKACMEAVHPVEEEPYEIRLDNHGCADGPKTGRLRALNNGPKLFDGINFYFSGFFVPPYKIDLQNLVSSAGGNIIESKDKLVELSLDTQATLVVYNSDPPQDSMLGEEGSVVVHNRLIEAEDLADEVGTRVVRHTWILESIAACKVQAYSLQS